MPNRNRLLFALLTVGAIAGGVASRDYATKRAEPAAQTKPEPLPAFKVPVQRPVDEGPIVAPPPPPKIGILPIPDDAIALAWIDAQTLSAFDLEYTRWVWVPSGEKPKVRAVSLTVNYVSRASTIIKPQPVSAGRLLRIDLRHYDPQNEGREWAKIWDAEFQFDPSFALLLTKDTVAFLAEQDRPQRRVERQVDRQVERQVDKLVTRRVPIEQQWRTEKRNIAHKGGDFIYPDDSGRIERNLSANLAGQVYGFELRFKDGLDYKEVTETVKQTVVETVKDTVSEDVPALGGKGAKAVDVIRQNRKDIDRVAFESLQLATHSLAPVVEWRYFVSRSLTTIEDKGVFKDVFGGLYFKLRGIKKAKDVLGKDTKATDLDLFFEERGIGNIKAGLTADALFDKLRSDQRVAIFRSDITGKPRDVVMFNVPGAKRKPFGAITGDIGDDQIDIGDRSFANLLNPRRKAREAIFPGANGLSIFALFNADGALQDEVPPDVAIDRGIPSPHTARLQSAISCIRCHGTDGSDGWKPLSNDAKTLLGPKGLNVFDDAPFGAIPKKRKSQADVVDRLVGLYAGDFTTNVMDARDGLTFATEDAMGPWLDAENKDHNVVRVGATYLSDAYASYNYALVDARQALKELGFDVPKEQAVDFLRALTPPDPRNAVSDIILESPRLAALHSGLSINRSDWALESGFVAERATRNPAWKALRSKR